MTDKIRWFRFVSTGQDLTEGKLYPATTVDSDGDLAVVDDAGEPCWVVITESYKKYPSHISGKINWHFREVIPDED